jgi:hypothetical protein
VLLTAEKHETKNSFALLFIVVILINFQHQPTTSICNLVSYFCTAKLTAHQQLTKNYVPQISMLRIRLILIFWKKNYRFVFKHRFFLS